MKNDVKKRDAIRVRGPGRPSGPTLVKKNIRISVPFANALEINKQRNGQSYRATIEEETGLNPRFAAIVKREQEKYDRSQKTRRIGEGHRATQEDFNNI